MNQTLAATLPKTGGSGCEGQAACTGFLQLEFLPFDFGYWNYCMKSSLLPSSGSTHACSSGSLNAQ